MSAKIYSSIFFLLLSISSFAQAPDWSWARSATGSAYDEGTRVATDANGNVYVAGNYESSTLDFAGNTINNAGPRDMFITKYDASGNVAWVRGTGGSSYDGIYDITTDASGNIFITGIFDSPTIVFGAFTLTNAGGSDMFCVKYDPNGNVVWAKRAGSGSYDDGYGISTDPSGDVFVVGIFQSSSITFGSYTLNNGGDNDVYIVKYDPSGNVLWAKRAGGSSWDDGFGIGNDANGNSYISGYFGSGTMTFDALTINNSTGSIFIAKYDPSGNAVWAKNGGGTGLDYCSSLATDANGNSVITGYYTSATCSFGSYSLTNYGGADIYVAAYNTNGVAIWAHNAGSQGDGVGYDVAADPNGNFYATGYFTGAAPTFGSVTLTNTGGPDVFAVKYDASGNVPWAVNPSGSVDDMGKGITADANGNVTVTGGFYSSSITFGTYTLNNTGNWDLFVARLGGCSLVTPTITPNGPTTFCAGGSVILISSAAATYLWSTGATTQSITVTTTGNYSVTIGNGSGCSANSAVVPVTVNPNPTPVISAGGPTTFCAGGSVVLTCSQAVSYLWSNGATTQSITVTTSGSYAVVANNGNGCSANSSAVVVTVNPNPIPTIQINGPVVFCEGGSVTLSSSPATSYLWSNSATSQSITVTSTGTYSVIATNANGCMATSSPVTITVYPNQTPVITPNGPTTFCEGGNVILSSTQAAGYIWSTGSTSQSIGVLTSGDYSVTVNNGNGCLASSTVTTVTVNPNPVATITPNGPTSFCAGGSVLLSANAADSYQWNNGLTTQVINAVTTGDYVVTITVNGCTGTNMIHVLQDVVAVGWVSTDASCGNNNGSVDITVTQGIPAYTYNWSTATTTEDISNLSGGTYMVTVTDSLGCQVMLTTIVNQTAGLLDSLSSTADYNCDGTASASASGGSGSYDYNWSNGGTGSSISSLCTGWYSVTISDSTGCQVIDSVFVPQGEGLNEILSAGLKLYPNPTLGSIIIQTDNSLLNGEMELSIYSTLGQLVLNSEINLKQSNSLDLSKLPDGVYYLQLKNDGAVMTKKIVVQK